VREVWLVHPTDQVVSIYTLNAEQHYGKAAIHPTTGLLTPTLFPELRIDWSLVFANLLPVAALMPTRSPPDRLGANGLVPTRIDE